MKRGFTHESTKNESKEVFLTKGFVALVDALDYPKVCRFHWHAFKGGKYAASHIGRKGQDGKRKQVTMHRLIMNLPECCLQQVDHINGNGRDNRRQNLRLCNNQQNHFNIIKRAGKGVCFVRGRWQANITKDGKTQYIGRYLTKTLAMLAYDNRARELFGKFARTNL